MESSLGGAVTKRSSTSKKRVQSCRQATNFPRGGQGLLVAFPKTRTPGDQRWDQRAATPRLFEACAGAQWRADPGRWLKSVTDHLQVKVYQVVLALECIAVEPFVGLSALL